MPHQAQTATHQQTLNRLTSTALYQVFISWIMSPICPNFGTGEKMAENILLSFPTWEAERQHHSGESIDITDTFQDNMNLLEFFVS